MNNNPSQNIKKSNLDKFKEFFHAIRIIYDARKLINEGKYYHITTIYGQLRALITDKTKERSKELKPLFEIASLLGEELKIYYMPNTINEDLPPSLTEGIMLHVSSLPISIEKQLSKQEEILLEDYLNIEIINFKGRSIKAFELINALSDKYGGSHYDTKVPDYLMELFYFGIGGQRVLDNLIIQIADLFLSIGLNLVKKLTDFEIYLAIFPEEFTTQENYFLDYFLENENSRIIIYSHQGKLKLHFVDLIGRPVNLEVKKIINPKNLYLINISHRITFDLRSEIRLNLDGINLLDFSLNEPLLMHNEISSYQSYLNRSKEKEKQEFEFGLAEMMMYGKILDDLEKVKLLNYFSQKSHEKLIWFNKNSFGYSPAGTSDIKMEGNVEQRDYKNKN
ncbi:hypothetical protein [Adhaeribacter rhizoryzae]|uniref:Uncharacterized protein n=1 Tax=Adhaeribacter rhizoryzae TaxID=2607907 RepID=A0A5M6DPU1_9BACT|nr:hypothetical protein [Adhaeribacter rhizoryzae]KAA5548416.1 hypothetical protein F0145_06730 [Adhaeribacter rhizoryzae]